MCPSVSEPRCALHRGGARASRRTAATEHYLLPQEIEAIVTRDLAWDASRVRHCLRERASDPPAPHNAALAPVRRLASGAAGVYRGATPPPGATPAHARSES